MKIKVRAIISAVFIFTMVMGMNTSAMAQSVNETEPNNTIETAQITTANGETAVGAVGILEGKDTGQFVNRGYTSISDPDWFKVYLKTGLNYMTCNDQSFDFSIYDSSQNIILKERYNKQTSINGFIPPVVYQFNVTTAGYYYVKITGITSTSESYMFLIGSPTYRLSHIYIPCEEGTITMKKADGTKKVNFYGNLLELPKGAVTYEVQMSKIRTNDVASIRLKNEKGSSIISLARFTWLASGLISKNLPVQVNWTADLEYFKDVTFTPQLCVSYVYPILQ